MPSYKLSKKDTSIIHTYSSPGIETGFIPVIEKIFPARMTTNRKLSPELVREADLKQLEIFTQHKYILTSYLNLTILFDAFNWVFTMLNITESTPYVLDDEEVFNILPNNSNSGFPLYVNKGSDIAREEVRKSMRVFRKLKGHKRLFFILSYPCVIFHRFTPKIKTLFDNVVNYKIRQVWGVPFFIIFLECKYLFWLKIHFTNQFKHFFTSGVRRTEVSNKISILRERARNENKFILCGDISGFDRSVCPSFYTILECLIHNTKDHNHREIMLLIFRYFTYTPFIGIHNRVEMTRGGTASGNYLTTVFNSLIMMIVVVYNYIYICGKLPEQGDFLVQGDDFIMLIPNKECFSEIKSNFKIFNLRIKLYDNAIVNYEEDIEFLGFKWDSNGEPDQSDEWLVSRIIYPENYVELAGPERIISRYLSLIFQLKRYRSLFKNFYFYDRVFKRILESKDVFKLRIIDKSGRVTDNVFPINKFLHLGWRAY